MNTHTLGEPRFASTLSHTISDAVRIPERIEIGAEPGITFELAGRHQKGGTILGSSRGSVNMGKEVENLIVCGVNIHFRASLLNTFPVRTDGSQSRQCRRRRLFWIAWATPPFPVRLPRRESS
jgi:hypothetical protein